MWVSPYPLPVLSSSWLDQMLSSTTWWTTKTKQRLVRCFHRNQTAHVSLFVNTLLQFLKQPPQMDLQELTLPSLLESRKTTAPREEYWVLLFRSVTRYQSYIHSSTQRMFRERRKECVKSNMPPHDVPIPRLPVTFVWLQTWINYMPPLGRDEYTQRYICSLKNL